MRLLHKKLLLCGLMCLAYLITPAQNELDSLIRLAKTYQSKCTSPCINDSDKVNILDGISWELKSVDLDSALFVANEALALAKKIGWKRGIARGETQKGICLRYLGKLDEAIVSVNTSVTIWDEMIAEGYNLNACKLGKIKALFQLCNISSTQGDFVKAVEYGERSLKLADEINNKKMKAGQIGNLGIVYQSVGDYPKALEYYFQSLKLAEELGEKRSIAINYGSIGYMFIYQKEYDKALAYTHKALKMSQELGDKQMEANYLGDVGSIYEEKKDLPNAIDYYSKGAKMAEEIKDSYSEYLHWIRLSFAYAKQNEFDKSLDAGNKALSLSIEMNSESCIADSRLVLGNCLFMMKNYTAAEKDLLIARDLAKKTNKLDLLSNAEELLSQLYKSTGKYELAYEHYKSYIQIRDSLANEETSRKQIKATLGFEFDKKASLIKEQQEKERILAEEKSRVQRIIIIGVIVVLLIVLFFTYMVLKTLRVTRKQKGIIEQKEKETQQQNLIITEQKHLVEEKQKEIIDSINYAKRIQYTLLAHDTLLNENLNEYFVFFNPKDIVSGDFYWATKHNNKFYLAVCDSTGHGVPGAFMSLLNISFLNEAITERGIEQPHEVLNYARERLTNSISKEGQKDGFDGILLCIDKTNNIIQYAAANNAPLQTNGDTYTELPKDKMPVGVGERKESFSLHTIEGASGDMLFLYTDGYADQFGGEKGKKFKYKPLNELLCKNAGETMLIQKENLLQHFITWKGELEQVDDVCIIGIRV